MLTVEEYGRIRIAHRDGMSIRQIPDRARRLGPPINPGTPTVAESTDPYRSFLYPYVERTQTL